jgi:GNAT superfamily N-acetyltransferase
LTEPAGATAGRAGGARDPMGDLLFETPRFRVRELGRDAVPAVQALFDANPEYFVTVGGRAPRPDEAQVEFDELPPDHLSYTRRWFGGVFGRDGALEGVVIVVSDLSAPAVSHLALFLVATRLHGSGAAAEVYAALESWIVRSGAHWLRLGVVAGNARAERFWQQRGFDEVRQRFRTEDDGRTNTIRVLVKPLRGGSLDDYLRLVPRDRPDSSLP